MFLFKPPKIPAYNPPDTSQIAEAKPEPPPEAKLDADLPQTDEEVQARLKANQKTLAMKQGLTGMAGLKIPLMPSNPVV